MLLKQFFFVFLSMYKCIKTFTLSVLNLKYNFYPSPFHNTCFTTDIIITWMTTTLLLMLPRYGHKYIGFFLLRFSGWLNSKSLSLNLTWLHEKKCGGGEQSILYDKNVLKMGSSFLSFFLPFFPCCFLLWIKYVYIVPQKICIFE